MKKYLIALCALIFSFYGCTDLTYKGTIEGFDESIAPDEPSITDPTESENPDNPDNPDVNELTNTGNTDNPDAKDPTNPDDTDNTDTPDNPDNHDVSVPKCYNDVEPSACGCGITEEECASNCKDGIEGCIYDIRNVTDYQNLSKDICNNYKYIRFIGNVSMDGADPDKNLNTTCRIVRDKHIIGVPWLNTDENKPDLGGDFAVISGDNVNFSLYDVLQDTTVKNLNIHYKKIDTSDNGVLANNLTDSSIEHINVTVEEFICESQKYNVGGVVGLAECLPDSSNDCLIDTVKFEGKMDVTYARSQIGGILGNALNYEIKNVTFIGSLNHTAELEIVVSDPNTKIMHIGGIIGWANHIVLENASMIGNIDIKTAFQDVGGIIGYVKNSKLTSCTVKGENAFDYQLYEFKDGNEKVEYKPGETRTVKGAIINAVPAFNVGGIVGKMQGGTLDNQGKGSAIYRIRGINNIGGVVGSAILGDADELKEPSFINMNSIVNTLEVPSVETYSGCNANSVIGGFIGYGNYVSVKDSSSIVAGSLKGKNYVGGFAGEIKYKNTLSNIYSQVDTIEPESKYSVGGFIGYLNVNQVSDIMSFVKSIKANDVEGEKLGGFAGYIEVETESSGDVNGLSRVFSVVDKLEGTQVGGFIGEYSGGSETVLSMTDIFSMSNIESNNAGSVGFIYEYEPEIGIEFKNVVSASRRYAQNDVRKGNYLFKNGPWDDKFKHTVFENMFYYQYKSEVYAFYNDNLDGVNGFKDPGEIFKEREGWSEYWSRTPVQYTPRESWTNGDVPLLPMPVLPLTRVN